MGQTSSPPPWQKSQEARFAAALAAVSAALIAVIVLKGPAQSGERPLGDEHALKAIQQRLKTRHRNHAAAAVDQACRRYDCTCVVAAAKAGLDADGGKELRELLDAAKACPEKDQLEGMRAEALVRAGAKADGVSAAAAVLKAAPSDPYALGAVALAAYLEAGAAQAVGPAQAAVTAGRGDGGSFLFGLVELALGDLARARAGFEAVLRSEPEDTDALYNLAVVAQKQDRYGEARRLYLDVLRLEPRQKEARFNLGILTHSIGAQDEANHHLAKLEAVAPGDPLVASLRATLATPAHPPGQVLKLGQP